MLCLLREQRLQWNSKEGHEFVRNCSVVLKILPPIKGYPAGIQITQNEWSLGLMHWQSLATEEVRYYRNVNGNFVPIVMSQENWQVQDTFYKKVLRVQLRSREMERSEVDLKCLANWIVFHEHDHGDVRRISRYWVTANPWEKPEHHFDRSVCEVQYPMKMRRTPTTHVLRHFFSSDQMVGCHDAVALHPYLLHSDYEQVHREDDRFFRGNFRDVCTLLRSGMTVVDAIGRSVGVCTTLLDSQHGG